MEKLVVIDGNSIINRAFYGIMGNKMLMADGTYTNAVYGFLAILFKTIEDLKPEYLAVAFDLRKPTKRHEIYKEYKATRNGMPDELAMQMPILKEILHAMNITILEKEGYEADDILGTLAKKGAKGKLQSIILTGDRDAFQLASKNIIIRIPRTKMGKTEEEDFDLDKIVETYGINPEQLIDVKGLMGDKSDNIPGVPGIGEKTAIELIKEYKNIDNLYENIENNSNCIKGKLKEKLVENKELAYLSKTLGTIDTEVPIDVTLENIKVKEWNKEEVTKLFKKYRFNRYIERFNLEEETKNTTDITELFMRKEISNQNELQEVLENIKNSKQLTYYLETKQSDKGIIKKEIKSISLYAENKNIVYDIKITKENFIEKFKEIFENNEIIKTTYKSKETYILLKELGIETYISYDVELAGYLLNSSNNKYTLEDLSLEYLKIDLANYLEQTKTENKAEQINMFEINSATTNEEITIKNSMYVYCIGKLEQVLTEKLKELNVFDLYSNIEVPVSKVLAYMQFNGIYIDKEELINYGKKIEEKIEVITKEIYESCGEEFNINSPKQLGEILFEKLKLTVYKKTKTGYSTDVDILEKLKNEHPIIEKILDYRQLMKLNSTYVVGMIPYINKETKRVHSYFHQTVTATGRISSTEPNLQNIPTRFELGKQLRKVFKAEEGKTYIDADYSQIELRILAHISEDANMIQAFNNDEDIHSQAASKVFNIPLDKVTAKERSQAKAVNFGIVYGISDFGLGEQLGISRKAAKEYIEQYLDKYEGIKQFMDNITKVAQEQGYVETLFKRRRYIPEITSNNYLVRQFGKRVALNTPIQGTAADIMKIAMINVAKELEIKKLKSKIVLQVHDELLLEVPLDEKDIVTELLQKHMENVIQMKIPLKVEISEAKNWYDAK